MIVSLEVLADWGAVAPASAPAARSEKVEAAVKTAERD